MMNKRSWKSWPKNYFGQLKNFVPFSGMTLTTGAFTYGITSYAFILPLTLGLVTTSLLTPLYLSRPEKKLLLTENSLETLNLQQIDRLDEKVPKVGIIGLGNAGKTTLVRQLTDQSLQTTSTSGIYGIPCALQGCKHERFLLLDASGQNYHQQFDLTRRLMWP